MNKANEKAIEVVKMYIERLENPSEYYWRSSDFAQQSYAKTAANDILLALMNDREAPPLMVIEEYRDMVSKLSCLNAMGSFGFSVAQDIADDISNDLAKAYY